LAAALALLALASALASCDTTEEDAPQVATEQPTASAQTTPARSIAPSATHSPGRTQATLPGGYEFSYPSSWNLVVVSDDRPYIARFFVGSPKPSDEVGELAVFVYVNPQRLAPEEFFNGQQRPNLFEDAVGGYTPYSAGGATGYSFHNVLGFTNYTVVALSSDGFVYQFEDAQRHQADGEFSRIVSSLKASKD
jgi:hypothetical protein